MPCCDTRYILWFGVVTMLLRRIEEREIIDVFHMANWLKAFVEEQAHCYQ